MGAREHSLSRCEAMAQGIIDSLTSKSSVMLGKPSGVRCAHSVLRTQGCEKSAAPKALGGVAQLLIDILATFEEQTRAGGLALAVAHPDLRSRVLSYCQPLLAKPHYGSHEPAPKCEAHDRK